MLIRLLSVVWFAGSQVDLRPAGWLVFRRDSLSDRLKSPISSQQSPDGKYLASGAIDGIINIFDIATGKLLHTLEGIHSSSSYFVLPGWIIRSQSKNASFVKM